MNKFLHTTLTEVTRALVRSASTGHVDYLCGEVSPERYLKMAEKFGERYYVDRNAALKTYHYKKNGTPSIDFVAWQKEKGGKILWWLLAKGGAELFKANGETKILSLKSKKEELVVDGRYVLKRTSIPKKKNKKTGQMEGGGESVTFKLTDKYFDVHLVNIKYLASAHGNSGNERIDDLRREVEAVLSFPRWRGVRSQVQRLLAAGVDQWVKTHRSPFPVELPEKLTFLTPVRRKRACAAP